MTIDLDVFRTATLLEWKRWTVFAPHRGDDGTLIADGVHRLPLDTYPPDTLTGQRASWPPLTENVGIVVVDPTTVDDVHSAVRQWCINMLDRSDINFTA